MGVRQAAPGAAAAGGHGFAAVLTSFVGRAEQLAEAAALLGECRLVTVTGPGGVGKTRLAGEVARRVAGRFADGVWLAELAGVGDPALVPDVVAQALGLHLAPGVPLTEALAGRCCWFWLTASTWPQRPATCAWRCCWPLMMCGCWRPAASRWGCRGRPVTGCRRSGCRGRSARPGSPGRRRCSCSRTGPAGP